MKIAIGTLNKAKNKAVKQVIEDIWDAEFFSTKTNSNVNEQPLTEEEGISGAINRANQALKEFNADYGIGLEGFVKENKYGMFLGGAVAIIYKSNEKGIGISSLVEIPKNIRVKIKQGNELGPLIQKLMQDKDNNIRHTQGANGILTNNLYNRVNEFKDATKCALAKFISKEFYYQPK